MNPLIAHWQLEEREGRLLLGIAIQHAVLDINTDAATLAQGLQLLESPPNGLRHMAIGLFGSMEVTLNHHHEGTVSIFVDGPDFSPNRNQSAAIWVDRDNLCAVFREAISKSKRLP